MIRIGVTAYQADRNPLQRIEKVVRMRDAAKRGDRLIPDHLDIRFLSGLQVDQRDHAHPGLNHRHPPGVEGGHRLGIAGISTAGQANQIRPLQCRQRLPQFAGGKNHTVSERPALVAQQNIEVAVQSQVLKSVVEDQCIHTPLFDGVLSGGVAVFPGQHRNVFQTAGDHHRLIPRDLRRQQDLLTVAHHVDRPGRISAVSPAQHRRFESRAAQGIGNQNHHGRFSGAAQGEVADTDDPAFQAARGQ